MNDIFYTTPEEQIEKLKAQNLIIQDETVAKEALQLFGYSNVIKNYREPYVTTSENKIIYRSGVSFEQVSSLYILDKNLRNGTMAAMQDLEEHVKEVAADIIANSFGTHQDEYLQYEHYRNKYKRKYRFTLSGLLGILRQTLDTNKNPIHYYKVERGFVPPWILFKSIYFSTIVNFIDQFKTREQNALAHRLYNLEKLNISEPQARMLLMNTLYICLEYRNVSAHGGKVYNFKSKNKLSTQEIFNKDMENLFGLHQFLFLLKLLKYQDPFVRLSEILNDELTRHCNYFPEDATYLAEILNISITPRRIVFVSKSSDKYHANSHCSGIKGAYSIELEEAKKQGYIPCKRCANNITPIT